MSFLVTDNRAGNRLITSNLDNEFQAAKLGVPMSAATMSAQRDRVMDKERQLFSKLSSNFGGNTDANPVVQEMRANRRANKNAMSKTAFQGAASELNIATGRPRDPFFYWRQNNLPYDATKSDELRRIRDYCRLLYLTHPAVGTCIDIYSMYPLTGMEIQSKDEQITDFYTQLFLETMEYDDFMVDIGREYFTVGESWALGQFDEVLGIWSNDQLINPDNMEVEQTPFDKSPRFFMRLPENLRKILQSGQPRWQYDSLVGYDSTLKEYMNEDDLMPVSDILMEQFRFKADTFNPRGVPLLLRCFRALIQEEMLNSAQDAIADRLYTPLILAKIGAKAQDLGTDMPWIPTDADLGEFEEALDAAMAGDFRVLTYNFGIEIETVFGKETMPDFADYYDRLEDRILQTFGLSRTMLQGSEAGKTYAADALNRDLISQRLTHYQKMLKRFFKRRVAVVAEAQEHWDYEVRNGIRYVIKEEQLVIDPETGEQKIIEKPKTIDVDIHMRTMNVQDDNMLRQFYEGLRAQGVPISMKSRMLNVPLKLDEEAELSITEQVDLAVKAQETRRETYSALVARGLPVPSDLKNDFQAMAKEMPLPPQPPMQPAVPGQEGDPGAADTSGADPDQQTRPPLLGIDPAAPTNALSPSPSDLMAPSGSPQQSVNQMQENMQGLKYQRQMNRDINQPGGADKAGQPPTQALPRNKSSVPPESNEMRKGMPKPASLAAMKDGPTHMQSGYKLSSHKEVEETETEEDNDA